jgi:hypothetical protein
VTMSVAAFPKSAARVLADLTGEPRPDVALLLVLRDAIAYRLERIEAGLRAYEEKYGLPFEAYKRRWETEDRPEDYTYEAEQDYLDWEALVTRKKRLEESYGWLA